MVFSSRGAGARLQIDLSFDPGLNGTRDSLPAQQLRYTGRLCELRNGVRPCGCRGGGACTCRKIRLEPSLDLHLERRLSKCRHELCGYGQTEARSIHWQHTGQCESEIRYSNAGLSQQACSAACLIFFTHGPRRLHAGVAAEEYSSFQPMIT